MALSKYQKMALGKSNVEDLINIFAGNNDKVHYSTLHITFYSKE